MDQVLPQKKSKKKFIIIALIAFFVLMAGIGLFVFKLTGSLTVVADDFFVAVKSDNYSQAYSLLSTDFQKEVELEDFKKVVKIEEYNLVVSQKWTNRLIENNVGTLEGSVSLSDGRVFPLNVFLVKEVEVWKIDGIRKMNSHFTNESKKISTNEAELIVNNSLLDFYESVSVKDFTVFYNGLSKSWQQQITVEELNESFKNLFDNLDYLEPIVMGELVLGDIEVVEPEYNVNQIKVSFKDGDKVLDFRLKVLPENSEWKLIGFYLE